MITLMICAVLSVDVTLSAPTPADVAFEMLMLAGVQEDDIVYDLGSGNGVILVVASKIFRSRSVGIEIDEDCVEESRENVTLNGVDDLVRVYQGNILEYDIHQASVITLYLMPNLSKKLLPTLKELKPGIVIVAHDKPIPGVKPKRVVDFHSELDNRKHKLYLWITPFEEIKGKT